jgi:hypothetical protein
MNTVHKSNLKLKFLFSTLLPPLVLFNVTGCGFVQGWRDVHLNHSLHREMKIRNPKVGGGTVLNVSVLAYSECSSFLRVYVSRHIGVIF